VRAHQNVLLFVLYNTTLIDQLFFEIFYVVVPVFSYTIDVVMKPIFYTFRIYYLLQYLEVDTIKQVKRMLWTLMKVTWFLKQAHVLNRK